MLTAAIGVVILIFGAWLHSHSPNGSLLVYAWRRLMSKWYYVLIPYGITLMANGLVIVILEPGYFALPLFWAIPLSMILVVISGIVCFLRRQWIAGIGVLAILIFSHTLFVFFMIGLYA